MIFPSGKNQLSGAPTMILQVTELGTQETCLLSELDGMHWGIASSRPTGVLPEAGQQLSETESLCSCYEIVV